MLYQIYDWQLFSPIVGFLVTLLIVSFDIDKYSFTETHTVWSWLRNKSNVSKQKGKQAQRSQTREGWEGSLRPSGAALGSAFGARFQRPDDASKRGIRAFYMKNL